MLFHKLHKENVLTSDSLPDAAVEESAERTESAEESLDTGADTIPHDPADVNPSALMEESHSTKQDDGSDQSTGMVQGSQTKSDITTSNDRSITTEKQPSTEPSISQENHPQHPQDLRGEVPQKRTDEASAAYEEDDNIGELDPAR